MISRMVPAFQVLWTEATDCKVIMVYDLAKQNPYLVNTGETMMSVIF